MRVEVVDHISPAQGFTICIGKLIEREMHFEFFPWRQDIQLPRGLCLKFCGKSKYDIARNARLLEVSPYHISSGCDFTHGCQMAIAGFLDRMCLALRASGLWLRYATLQNLILSFPWIAPGWRAWGRNFAIWQH